MSVRSTKGIAGSFLVLLALFAGCGTTHGTAGGPGAKHTAAPGGGPEGTRADGKPGQAFSDGTRGGGKWVVVRKEKRLRSGSGATFLVPVGWSLQRLSQGFSLRDPEKDVRVYLVELPGNNAADVVARAWKIVDPAFSLKVKSIVSPPVTGGWDKVTQVVYDVPDSEHRVVFAIARLKGKLWYVALLDGSGAGFSRRGAQAVTIIKSVDVPGVKEESFAGKPGRLLDAGRLAKLETFFDKARKALEIPGAAVAIVQNGKVLFDKGFGRTRLGGKRSVTPKTLFMIGSTTKSLTTLMMARFVDKGLFSWSTPVTKVLPSFTLGDPKLTRSCQMRHTVCACTGMPRQDMEFLFEYDGVTPEQRIAFMKTMKPTTGFGETFQYSNIMVALGGFAAAHALYPKRSLGAAYDAAMSKMVFGPLGMRSTTFDYRRVMRRNHATPHSVGLDGAYHPISVRAELGVYPIRPAGAAWSNVEDMARYLLVELGRGKLPDGTRIVSEENLLARRRPQIRILPKLYYGLGLMVRTDHGVEVVQHDGNNLGYTTGMFFLPRQGVGVVILTNAADANSLTKLVRRRLFELLFDADEKAEKMLAFFAKRRKEELRKFFEKLDPKPDAKWVEQVSGRYRNPSLGVVKVFMDRGVPWLDAGEWRARVARKREPSSVAWLVTGAPLTGLTFQPGSDGHGHKTLTLTVGQQKYVFVETAVPRSRRAR